MKQESDPGIVENSMLVVLILLISIIGVWSVFPDSGTSASLTRSSSDPIRIEGNSELASHPEVDSGSGTVTDPYLISDLTIDCRTSGKSGLYIKDTTYHLVLKNITILASSSSPAIYLRSYYSGGYKSMNLDIRNVTVIGGGQQLYMYVPVGIYISDCNFSNPGGTGDLIYSYYGYYIDFHNNTFNSPEMDIDLYKAYYIDFTRNHGSIRDYIQDRFRYSDISNNTLESRSFLLYGGYSSTFIKNRITGSSSEHDLVWFTDCNRIMIANNTFRGGKDAVGIQHPNEYDPVKTTYDSANTLEFENNIFNQTAGRGLYFYWATGHPYMSYMSIHHNSFLGCSGYAIELNSGGSATSKVYRNVFMYNHGSGTEYSTVTTQARDGWSRFAWSLGSTGNYWHDWDNQDENSDGFSDTKDYALSSNNGQTDPFPVSNRFFDMDPPELDILTPATRFLDRKYVNYTWIASDDETGISMIRIRKNMGIWTDITDRDHHGLYLSNGQHNVDISAVDLGGLKKTISQNLVIEDGKEPFSFVSPVQDGFYGSSVVPIEIELLEGFVPSGLSCRLNGGEWIERDPFSTHSLDLSDGLHSYEMTFSDHYGNSIRRSVDFTVDTRPPEIEITDPADSSVISNSLVHLKWTISDLTSISKTELEIDGETIPGVEGNSYTAFLDKGEHTVSVEVTDMAGNSAISQRTFNIGKNTSLHITAPRLDSPTRNTVFTLHWEYLSQLTIESVNLIVDNKMPLNLPGDTTSYQVTFSNDGKHTVKVEAVDGAGNIYSDSVDMEVDRKPPTVGFKEMSNGMLLNSTRIHFRWTSDSEDTIAGYDLLLDDEKIAEGIREPERLVEIETEGLHRVSVKAYDLAGNMAREDLDFTLDTISPELELTSPSSKVVTEQYVDFEWIGNDPNGIDHFSYSIDGGNLTEIGTSPSMSLRLEEGDHTLILKCMDRAGNHMSVRKDFKVDLNPPEVEILNLEDEFINTWNGLVEWNITERMGISAITLEVDGIRMELSGETEYQMIDLDDGPHSIGITVTDISGRIGSHTVHFTLDRVEPMVSEGDLIVDRNIVTIDWLSEEDASSLHITTIMDGENGIAEHDLQNGVTTFREVPPGSHTIILTFKDDAGNEKTMEFEFEVQEAETIDNSGEGSSVIIPILVMAILISVISIVVVMVFRKRKKVPEETKIREKPNKPERISIGPLPAVKRETVAPKPIPPATRARKASDIGLTGDSYIRPDKKKPSPVKRTRSIGIPGERAVAPEQRSAVENDDSIEDWTDLEELEEFEEMEDY